MSSECLNWEDFDLDWDNNPYNWDEVCVAIDVVSSVVSGGGVVHDNWQDRYNQLSDDTKSQFIKLIVKVRNQKSGIYSIPYESEIDTEKDHQEITIEDVQIISKEILNFDIDVVRNK